MYVGAVYFFLRNRFEVSLSGSTSWANVLGSAQLGNAFFDFGLDKTDAVRARTFLGLHSKSTIFCSTSHIAIFLFVPRARGHQIADSKCSDVNEARSHMATRNLNLDIQFIMTFSC